MSISFLTRFNTKVKLSILLFCEKEIEEEKQRQRTTKYFIICIYRNSKLSNKNSLYFNMENDKLEFDDFGLEFEIKNPA
ncbi:hypothetical protein FAQ01_03100 [Flavobacterium aquatile]|nr:hypothetical protein FAQ01_03100 [Flavobacterium aquatile]